MFCEHGTLILESRVEILLLALSKPSFLADLLRVPDTSRRLSLVTHEHLLTIDHGFSGHNPCCPFPVQPVTNSPHSKAEGLNTNVG